jgi:hypothetical protein
VTKGDLINLLSALLDHIAAEETGGYTRKGLSKREQLLSEGYKALGEIYERKDEAF